MISALPASGKVGRLYDGGGLKGKEEAVFMGMDDKGGSEVGGGG